MKNVYEIRPSNHSSLINYLKDNKKIPIGWLENKSEALKAGLFRGTLFHLCIEKFLKGNKDPLETYLQENLPLNYLANVDNDIYITQIKKEFIENQEKIYKLIVDFMEQNKFTDAETCFVEKKFPVRKLFEHEKILIGYGGTADLVNIDHKKKVITIVDWKTNRSMTDEAKEGYKKQLLIYALNAQLDYPDYKIRGILAWIPSYDKLYGYKFTFTEKNITDLKTEMAGISLNIAFLNKSKEKFLNEQARISENVDIKDEELIILKANNKLKISLKKQIAEIDEQNKKITKKLYAKISEVTEEPVYNFVKGNILFSSYQNKRTNYEKALGYACAELNKKPQEIIDANDCTSKFYVKNISFLEEDNNA